MKSRLIRDIKPGLPVRSMAVAAIGAAILLAIQVALSGLANIELVSLLVMLYTLSFKRVAIYSIYTFVVLEGLIYGFALWWVTYLYVWAVLAGVTWLCRKMESPLGWAVVSGAFGLVFGALCTIPYFFIGGFAMAVAYWVSGIPFDLAHCAGNFFLCLLLWRPLRRAFDKISDMVK